MFEEWPRYASSKKWKICLNLIRTRGFDYIDVTTQKLVSRNNKNMHAFYFKGPFCAPFVYKSLVVWAYNKLYNLWMIDHQPSKEWLYDLESSEDELVA